MNNPFDLIVRSDDPDNMISAFQIVIREVPREVRRKLVHIMMSVAMTDGNEGLFHRFNGRSVAEILENSKESLESQPIASGEVEGVRFELFEKPGTPDGDSLGPEC